MNLGPGEIAMLAGSLGSALGGLWAALDRQRVGVLLALNVIFAGCFAYYGIQALRLGGGVLLVVFMGLVVMHGFIASAMVNRSKHRSPDLEAR